MFFPMDAVEQIKMRLPIEQLVGQYCQLQKKGRNFVGLCPFHNDTHPSFLVSPDKGIAYCFACRSGGDIFSVYQKLEGVDFPQAIRELAEKTGVTIAERPSAGPKKDEKDRARECLHAAQRFFQDQLSSQPRAREYLSSRGVPAEQIEEFSIGYAPDSFSLTYEHLLKAGYSRREILAAGLGVQQELKEERIYDRFRNRILFPIHDAAGNLVGFGGRTLGDDAKYINSAEGILFHKSGVLFGLHQAKDAIREKGCALLVEGYFDVLACRRCGASNVVATCGTALTEQHSKLLHRYADRVQLCLDSDSAGQDAMERAFILLASQGLHVDVIELPGKDPADVAQADATLLRNLLEGSSVPYLDAVLRAVSERDLTSPLVRREQLRRLLPLLGALPSAVERHDWVKRAAAVFQTTDAALEADLQSGTRGQAVQEAVSPSDGAELFSPVEIALGLFLCYPDLRSFLPELIEPEEGFAKALYAGMRDAAGDTFSVDAMKLATEHRERAAVLHLYCEQHAFTEWSQGMASREIRKHCRRANRDLLHRKQEEITRKLLTATREGKVAEQAQLQLQYQQVLRLMQMAS